MSERIRKKIIDEILGPGSKHGEEHLYLCPSCNHHKKKLSVNFSKNVFKCWVCDYSGKNLRRIVKKHGQFYHIKDWPLGEDEREVGILGEQMFQTEETAPEQVIQLPEEFCSLANKDLPIGTLFPRGYLERRGITKKDVIRWKIGYCSEGKYAGRVVVPSFGLTGRCNYFVARSYNNDWRKYLNPNISKDIIFNELYIDWDSDIILVEGIFDAIVAGPNAIPILGSTLREESRLFKKIVEADASVYLALDPDAEKKTNMICKKFLQYGIETRKVSVDPFNDVAEMSKKQFKNRLQTAELITEDNYLIKTIMSL